MSWPGLLPYAKSTRAAPAPEGVGAPRPGGCRPGRDACSHWPGTPPGRPVHSTGAPQPTPWDDRAGGGPGGSRKAAYRVCAGDRRLDNRAARGSPISVSRERRKASLAASAIAWRHRHVRSPATLPGGCVSCSGRVRSLSRGTRSSQAPATSEVRIASSTRTAKKWSRCACGEGGRGDDDARAAACIHGDREVYGAVVVFAGRAGADVDAGGFDQAGRHEESDEEDDVEAVDQVEASPIPAK